MRLGPNDRQPCGTEGARRTHWAHGQICAVCEPEADREERCPTCRARVIVSGGQFVTHLEKVVVSGQFQTGWRNCPGSDVPAQVAA